MNAIPVPLPSIIGNAAYLAKNFERAEGGWIAYKVFNSMHQAPASWKIEAGSVIKERRIDDRVDTTCSYGINVANNPEWVYSYIASECATTDKLFNHVTDVWKVFIPDASIIVIPDLSNGKIRVTEIHLLEVVGTASYTSTDGRWHEDGEPEDDEPEDEPSGNDWADGWYNDDDYDDDDPDDDWDDGFIDDDDYF